MAVICGIDETISSVRKWVRVNGAIGLIHLGLGVADAKVGDQRPKDWALLWLFGVSFPAPGR